ncbi:unnamed protein product, partial [Scytosiphon promiscuus]
FRKEFVERVGEAGGLKALALSWNGVAKLDAAFVAWVGEVAGGTGTDLKAEILRVVSLVETLVHTPPPHIAGAGSSSSKPSQALARLLGGGGANSNSGGIYRAASESPLPGAATTAAAAAPGAPQIDDHHRPLPLAADPPVGAPLRPRHHVCRDRLSAAAAAALLRGADGGGGGWRGGAVVTFAGSSGAGKACLAAEVVGRRDVRAKFGDGVLWLQVGRSGGADLAAVLQRLAHAYHKVVLSRRLRRPPQLPPINRFRGPRNG